MKMEFSSQRRDILWFFTTSMSAMTSRTNQQLAIFSFSYVWDQVGVESHRTMGLFLGTNLNPVFCVTPKYARKEEIASPKQSPCNSTQHRSNLTHDLQYCFQGPIWQRHIGKQEDYRDKFARTQTIQVNCRNHTFIIGGSY